MIEATERGRLNGNDKGHLCRFVDDRTIVRKLLYEHDAITGGVYARASYTPHFYYIYHKKKEEKGGGLEL
nr:hypothetical protein 10 [Deltaproteobacteria bacterium]